MASLRSFLLAAGLAALVLRPAFAGEQAGPAPVDLADYVFELWLRGQRHSVALVLSANPEEGPRAWLWTRSVGEAKPIAVADLVRMVERALGYSTGDPARSEIGVTWHPLPPGALDGVKAAGATPFRGGIRVASGDVDGDGADPAATGRVAVTAAPERGGGSRWVRMSQSHAGGAIALPRVGWELAAARGTGAVHDGTSNTFFAAEQLPSARTPAFDAPRFDRPTAPSIDRIGAVGMHAPVVMPGIAAPGVLELPAGPAGRGPVVRPGARAEAPPVRQIGAITR